ncbi:MAG: peptide-methionine (S)-S-oxide reductase MsrA [Gammaproteobacteria bacterium]|nr:peptide-methionine (S)-S-oxide reductase MsrA [Gammaproteobacteria bacterium]
MKTKLLTLASIALLSAVSVTGATESADIATFAGGCFWCVEADFDHVPGVKKTISGYTGGKTENPTYDDVTYGDTGHFEAVQIHFDPSKVSYAELLEVFWRSVDPTDAGGQFCDRGSSYRTAIFAHSQEQLEAANKSKTGLEKTATLKQPIVTPILKAGTFYTAEEYHQNYYTKSPLRYRFYRYSCGRDARIEELWGQEAHQGIVQEK